MSDRTIQVYRIYIKATPERIWEAITDPEWNSRYGYAAPGTYDLRPGGAYVSKASDEMKAASAQMGWDIPEVVVDGEVIECDPPRLLKQTWRMLMDPTAAAEGFSTLTYTINDEGNGSCKVTIAHDVTDMPAIATMIAGHPADQADGEGGGGWVWVLSDLKSLIETGSAFTAA